MTSSTIHYWITLKEKPYRPYRRKENPITKIIERFKKNVLYTTFDSIYVKQKVNKANKNKRTTTNMKDREDRGLIIWKVLNYIILRYEFY